MPAGCANAEGAVDDSCASPFCELPHYARWLAYRACNGLYGRFVRRIEGACAVHTAAALGTHYEAVLMLLVHSYAHTTQFLPNICSLVISYYDKLRARHGAETVEAVLTCPEHGDRLFLHTLFAEMGTRDSAFPAHPHGMAAYGCTCGARERSGIAPPHHVLCFAASAVIVLFAQEHFVRALDVMHMFCPLAAAGLDRSAAAAGARLASYRAAHVNEYVCSAAAGFAHPVPAWFMQVLDYDLRAAIPTDALCREQRVLCEELARAAAPPEQNVCRCTAAGGSNGGDGGDGGDALGVLVVGHAICTPGYTRDATNVVLPCAALRGRHGRAGGAGAFSVSGQYSAPRGAVGNTDTEIRVHTRLLQAPEKKVGPEIQKTHGQPNAAMESILARIAANTARK